MRHSWIGVLARTGQRARVWTDRVADGVERIRIRSRWASLLGFEVSAYLVGDLLIDTGFSHVRREVLGLLDGRDIAAICCTHGHEDHTGNCGPLSIRHRCRVYLMNAALRRGEGVRRLKPYRAWFWGPPGRYDADEMPEVVHGSHRRLCAIPTPGHSVTHAALWEEATATVITGDLYIAPGASAVMIQENPYDLVDSLRRVAALEPRWMLTGHGMVVEHPAARLRLKADRVEEAAMKAVSMHRRGIGDREIVRRIFPSGNTRDRVIEVMTQGEYSRLNFVRAARWHHVVGES